MPTGPGLQVGLEVELDLASNWWCVSPLFSSTSLMFHSTPCPSPSFLSTSTSLGSNLFSFSQLEEQRNEFTSCFSCRARDLVIGPSLKIGGMVISMVLMSSSLRARHS